MPTGKTLLALASHIELKYAVHAIDSLVVPCIAFSSDLEKQFAEAIGWIAFSQPL